MEFERELDARGLACPLPILRTKKSLAAMDSGAVLKIVATDPHSPKDLQAFAVQTGHTLLQSSETGGEFHFWIRKK